MRESKGKMSWGPGPPFPLENSGSYHFHMVEWPKLGFGNKLVYGVVLESVGVIQDEGSICIYVKFSVLNMRKRLIFFFRWTGEPSQPLALMSLSAREQIRTIAPKKKSSLASHFAKRILGSVPDNVTKCKPFYTAKKSSVLVRIISNEHKILISITTFSLIMVKCSKPCAIIHI